MHRSALLRSLIVDTSCASFLPRRCLLPFPLPSPPSLVPAPCAFPSLVSFAAMGSSWSNMFVKKIDRNILLLGREGVGKTHLLYRLKGLSPKTGEAIELLPTNAFNHFQIDFHAFERQIEVWDPSGKPSHVSLWNTYYETVFFHVVIYVIDANCYDTLDAKRKAAAVREGQHSAAAIAAISRSSCTNRESARG